MGRRTEPPFLPPKRALGAHGPHSSLGGTRVNHHPLAFPLLVKRLSRWTIKEKDEERVEGRSQHWVQGTPDSKRKERPWGEQTPFLRPSSPWWTTGALCPDEVAKADAWDPKAVPHSQGSFPFRETG